MKENKLYTEISSSYGQIALLIDPEKTNSEIQLTNLLSEVKKTGIHYLFVGGSTASKTQVNFVVHFLKQQSTIPVILFPGSNKQFSFEADGILYLSLLSGTNPKYLIEEHIENSIMVYHSKLEILPTAYLLIDGETDSSVAKISKTKPLSRTAKKEALKISLAGILQGKKIIFLDAGSGAKKTVPKSMILEIKKHTNAPIIVGGGIKTTKKLIYLKKLGVNVIVVGNLIENNLKKIKQISNFLNDNIEIKQPTLN